MGGRTVESGEDGNNKLLGCLRSLLFIGLFTPPFTPSTVEATPDPTRDAS